MFTRTITRLALAGGIAFATSHAEAARLTPPDDLKAFMAQVETASAIADPYQRCLHMPDPPGSHWHADSVEAYCRFGNENTLDARQFRALIAAGQGARVDKAFASYTHAQLHDPAHPARLDAAIRRTGLRNASKATRSVIDEWMRQRPDSAFAVAASAIQYGTASLEARGSNASSQTSQRQFDAMHAISLQAREAFDRAAAMNPRIPTLYAYMYATGVILDDPSYANAALAKGLALQPNGFVLRLVHENMGGAKWGGSTADEVRQGTEAQDLASKTPLLRVVASRALLAALTDEMTHPPAHDEISVVPEVTHSDDLSNLAEFAWRAGHYDRALILAVEALRFESSNDQALYQVAKIAPSYGYTRWMRTTLAAAANDHPESVDVARIAGGMLSLYGDVATSEPLLKSVLVERPYDVWATDQLAALYAHEGKRPDEALRLVDDLIDYHPEDGWPQVIRARLLIAANDPRRYDAIKHFIIQFAQDEAFRTEVNELATYLNEHPATPRATG
ncbi:DUF4034 domain-containing protein [Bacillus sp. NP157]|nr:DUF4034 domain-containing protein [Bacillus sp. NP157]